MKPVRAVIGLGSNLDHPRRRIARAVRAIASMPGTRVERVSPNYVTAPLGVSGPQPDYVNAVAQISTVLHARALLQRMTAIERRHGRDRSAGAARNQARTLDLDLLLYGRRRIHLPLLTVPHPRMHTRAFVLRPLADIAPHWSIPGHGPARSLLRRVRNQRIARTRIHHLG